MVQVENTDRLMSYFKIQKKNLLIVTVTGIIYNVGMVAGPLFEGRMAQQLFNIYKGHATWLDMLRLALFYVGVIVAIQLCRTLKRFYVRRFANDTSRNMRHVLYNSIVHMKKEELESQQLGSVMTKAIGDVDACVEGMRKFTTEVFDTGVVMISYAALLCIYDIRLAVISCVFIPVAYFIANKCKKLVAGYNEVYKKNSGKLNQSTMDLVGNALTYRIFGQEEQRRTNYEEDLTSYEKSAVRANLWESTLQPIYHVIAMGGAVFIFYLGGRNVVGTGWSPWDIGMFTTFFSCFTKLSLKSSKAAKLFNAVQKAGVSWKRIKPMLRNYKDKEIVTTIEGVDTVEFDNVSIFYPGQNPVAEDLSFKANKGEIIGITGGIASGKSAIGKIFIRESNYSGSVKINGRELNSLSEEDYKGLISYMGHDPEIMSTSIAENIILDVYEDSQKEEILQCLKKVCLDREVEEMPQGMHTLIGSGGMGLSGGQQSRLALSRCLWHKGCIQVLDDPFSAVDKDTEELIFKEIRKNSSNQITMLISHRLDIFPQLDGILYLGKGKVVYGTHEELMKSQSGYVNLFMSQGGEEDA